MGQHPDRPLGRSSGFFGNQISHRHINRHLGIAEVVSATEICDVGSLKRPQRMRVKYMGQLCQVQIQKEQTIPKHIWLGLEAAMPNSALIYAAVHRSSLQILNIYD